MFVLYMVEMSDRRKYKYLYILVINRELRVMCDI